MRPSIPETMSGIRGVGARKLSDFGAVFASHITTWCAERGLDVNLRAGDRQRSISTVPDAKPPNANRKRAFGLFDRGTSIEAVADSLSLSPRTVEQYLVKWIVANKPDDVEAWVPADTYDQVADAASKVGFERLKPIHECLDGRIPYTQIRTVAAHLRPGKMSGSGPTLSPPAPRRHTLPATTGG